MVTENRKYRVLFE